VDLSAVPHVVAPPAPEPAAFDDPAFIRAADWLARAPAEPRAFVLGAPFRGGSISRARCDLAPAAVRRALSRFSVWSSDRAVSLDGFPVRDAGDVEPDGDDVKKTQSRIADAISALRALVPDAPIVLLGGDNSVTAGGARGIGADALLTLDAHHDCRDPSVRVTNGSVVRQLYDGGLTAVAQIGIHGFANAEEHARWALDHKIHSIGAAKVRADGIGKCVKGALGFLGRAQRIWVDVDLDVLERTFAPGAPAAMPGGLSTVEIQEAAYLLGRERRVMGLDITELDPTADVADATIRVACAVMLAFFVGVASR
jgi:arginase family enzyme